jgi:hypothetical protein
MEVQEALVAVHQGGCEGLEHVQGPHILEVC